MRQEQLVSTDVLGVQISPVNMGTAVNTIESWIQTRQKQYACLCTVHSVMEADKDPEFKQVLNGAGLCCPDGMPLVWLSHRQGQRQVTRVYGPDLMMEMCARSETTGHRHFFYGGGNDVVHQLVWRLRQEFPKLQVAGMIAPGRLQTRELEHPDTIATINAAQPDIVWVGLGCPKQEWWVANHLAVLDAPALLAVGAAFDFHSGAVKQAPRWMQRNGLEWSYRLSQDPARLWRRYLGGNARFVVRTAASLVRSPR